MNSSKSVREPNGPTRPGPRDFGDREPLYGLRLPARLRSRKVPIECDGRIDDRLSRRQSPPETPDGKD